MKSTLRFALAAATAQDNAGFTVDFTFDLDEGAVVRQIADVGTLLYKAFLA